MSVDVATEIGDTTDEEHDMGNMIYEMTLHLGSATIALLGPHVMVEQQAAGVPAEKNNKIVAYLSWLR